MRPSPSEGGAEKVRGLKVFASALLLAAQATAHHIPVNNLSAGSFQIIR
jgi:hypothetical protein